MLPRSKISTLIPYTTLFRSQVGRPAQSADPARRQRLEPHRLPDPAGARVPDRVRLEQPVLLAARLREIERVVFGPHHDLEDRKSTRLNSSHLVISYAVFCLK